MTNVDHADKHMPRVKKFMGKHGAQAYKVPLGQTRNEAKTHGSFGIASANPPGGPPDDDSGSSDDDEGRPKREEEGKFPPQKPQDRRHKDNGDKRGHQQQERDHYGNDYGRQEERSLGMNVIIKSFQGKKEYYGS